MCLAASVPVIQVSRFQDNNPVVFKDSTSQVYKLPLSDI